MQTIGWPEENSLRPLHPNQIRVLQLRGLVTALPLTALVAALDFGPLRQTPVPPGLTTAVVLAAALILLAILPPRRYRAWGYREEEDELHIGSGLLIRVRTVVPFGRVQHIDVAQGPIERRYGLATLILHTAGTRGAAVPLPGLPHEQAERMRDRIRAKIRHELGQIASAPAGHAEDGSAQGVPM
ncbi:PH domain-containing protein [Sphingosinicella sp. CPCC 101087]|uniref:PH domain-containing protein n=1 Tax=Sphingosinicella sp. CPCC 101087 TaxID=2497754 RepID=UPI00101DBC95|nr:PH domain-containing protein [Sphingosinicella sp. CPCC 101087]